MWSILSICFSFLRTFFLTRYLTEIELANLSIGLGVIAVCGVMISIPLNTSFVVIYKSKALHQRNTILKTINYYSTRLTLSCIFLSIVLLVTGFAGFEISVVISSFLFVLFLINQSILSVENYASYNQYSSILSTLLTLPIIYMIHNDSITENAIVNVCIVLLSINLFPALINSIFVQWKLKRENVACDLRLVYTLAKDSLLSAKLLYVSGIFGEITRMAARLVLQSFSEKLLVCYQIALWLMQPIQTLISHVVNMKIYPLLVEGKVSIYKFTRYAEIIIYSSMLFFIISYSLPAQFCLFFLSIIDKVELISYRTELIVIAFSELIRVLASVLGIIYIIRNRINLLAWFEIIYSLFFLMCLFVIYLMSTLVSIYLYVLPPILYCFLILAYNKLNEKNES